MRPEPARSCMRRTRSHPHLPGATDATSADFPRAISLQAQSNGEERGSRDSPAFRRHVQPVRLLLVRHPLRVELLASLLALRCRVCACVSVCAWGGGCGSAVRGSEPSRVPGFACMQPSPTDPRQPGGPSPSFSRVCPRRVVASLLFLLVWILCCSLCSLRVALESCVPPLSLQSTFVFNISK